MFSLGFHFTNEKTIFSIGAFIEHILYTFYGTWRYTVNVYIFKQYMFLCNSRKAVCA